MKGRMRNILRLIFAVLCLVLAGAIWIWPTPQNTQVPRNVQAAQPAPQEAVLDLEIITTRPLFDRTRKPLKLEAAPQPAAPKPVPITVSLKGVIGNADGGLTALLRLSNSEELFTRRTGETLGGFTVQRIESKRVMLRDEAGRIYVLLLGNE